MDGLSSMGILRKMATWYQKIVLHILVKQKEKNVASINNASQFQMFTKVILSEVVTASQVK